ncbi:MULTISPECIES: type VI secretion system-associated FHA domain protein TagH [Bosea]|uniref:type VI secretion system-associated FHA domain protein TagH n=1 Tax=Bosea TaxID=85413 RepID=UPI00214FAA9B|nr:MULTISPECIES: type VI secretion system-associated FHA domain protein TagH [Bosea]MCR4520880.1 type VI secretion system-associated FHA domain protein TagH [Bosea sp. 47.2.35]MDR6827570.1 type VI secretion system protein ImpI [Bosea robiniae]MDR6894280.1 type VI secretion system protein ImpI [Bosea sp. BE109]MDR7137676.1 type VI secretion system protein ImpI [Bosea sp. BE168]MDR7174375.1 type VI secretion system protein ImpI [Bosea sp. BE271]
MALTLTIENQTSLPDGGPLSVTTSGGRGLDIGRDQHLDWALPDPSRAVSGRHCEIRFRDGGWWLRDISTNGTFVNGGEHRVQSPYRLQNGDRLEIGHYIIAVAIEGEAGQAADVAPAPPPYAAQPESLWAPSEEAAPPIPRRDLMPPNHARPVHAGFIDWAADIPAPSAEPAPPPPARDWSAPAARTDEFAWAPLQPQPLPPEEPAAPIPTPRRPPAGSPASASPWDEPTEDTVPSEPAAEPPPAPAAFAPPPFPAEPAARQPGAPAPISMGEFMQRFAKGAGVSPQALATQDPGAFAEQLGGLMRLIAEELKGLLAARAETKRIARSTSQTMIQAQDNNPLKFSPTVDDALQLIFGQPRSGYLDAKRAFDESFRDLKAHQIKTYSAMQHALKMLVEDLDPQAINEATAQDGGISGLIGSRKAKMWEAYVARWDAKTAPYENGLVDAFMIYFAECYDRGGR